LPKRRRTRGRRPGATQQREREASPPPEARPAPSGVAPEETAERVERAPRRVSAPTAGVSKAAPRHITRDYSYVGGELKRIAITMSLIVAGLIATAIALR